MVASRDCGAEVVVVLLLLLLLVVLVVVAPLVLLVAVRIAAVALVASVLSSPIRLAGLTCRSGVFGGLSVGAT